MTRDTEGEAERERRRYQRGLFDGVARLYAATRPGYPAELAEFTVATAGLEAFARASGAAALWIQGWQVAAYWQALREARQADVEVWLDAEVRINRADFGLTWNLMGLVSKNNTLTIHAVFTKR